MAIKKKGYYELGKYSANRTINKGIYDNFMDTPNIEVFFSLIEQLPQFYYNFGIAKVAKKRKKIIISFCQFPKFMKFSFYRHFGYLEQFITLIYKKTQKAEIKIYNCPNDTIGADFIFCN